MPRKRDPEAVPRVARGRYQENFRRELKRRREGKGLTQAELDEKIDRPGRRLVGQIELGTMPPPNKSDCALIEGALGMAEGSLWDLAAPAHIERNDVSGETKDASGEKHYPREALAWLEERIERERDGLKPWERLLVEDLRYASVALWSDVRRVDLEPNVCIGEGPPPPTPEQEQQERADLDHASAHLAWQLMRLLSRAMLWSPTRRGTAMDFLIFAEAIGYLPEDRAVRLWRTLRTLATDAALAGGQVPESRRAALELDSDGNDALREALGTTWMISGPLATRDRSADAQLGFDRESPWYPGERTAILDAQEREKKTRAKLAELDANAAKPRKARKA